MLTTKKPAKAFECAQTMTASQTCPPVEQSRKSAPTKPVTAPTISAKTAAPGGCLGRDLGRLQVFAWELFAVHGGARRVKDDLVVLPKALEERRA